MANGKANNPTGDEPKWWWRWVPGYQRKWRVEKRREEILSSIRTQRSLVETMKQRPRTPADAFDGALFDEVLLRLSEIESDAQRATHTGQLDDLRSLAEQQGQLRAYFCPVAEIQSEAALVIDIIEEWGVPKTAIDKLKLHSEILKEADTRPLEARGALRAVFEERDSWEEYTDEYEDTMMSIARWLFPIAIGLIVLAVIALHFGAGFQPLLVCGLLAAGAAGSCVSVLTKMPSFDVALSAELESYQRRILSRISVGVAASVIGCALLALGPLSDFNSKSDFY